MSTRNAVMGDAIKISRMLEAALRQGWEGDFPINRKKLVDHVIETIGSVDGFAEVLVDDDGVVGCFMGARVPHAYCEGFIAQELGSYIMPEYRGNKKFQELFISFLNWASLQTDILFTAFSIGQIGLTTKYLRGILKEHGFIQVTEGFVKI